LAESQLSLNPPEAPVTAAATPTAGMDSTLVNIQRYPGETPTDNGHENNPIPSASDSLSEAERRLLGQDQAEVTTQELQVAAPHEQLEASDTAPLNPTVVQPQLATEPWLQREITIPEAPEVVEPSRESLVSESEPRVQIPEVTEEPPVIASVNPSVMRSADLSNVPPPQTSPVAPLPSIPADHLSGIEPIVSSEAELSPVAPMELAQDTEQKTQDVPSVPVQRREDEASPPSFVESLPLASQALPDTSQPPQSLVQTQATAGSPPPLNPPTAEPPSAIAPVLASDSVNVQPLVQPNNDSEAVGIAETSDFPPSTAGASATAGENLQESGITPSESTVVQASEPTVVQAFSETESSALSQSVVSSQENEPSTPSIPTTPTTALSTPVNEPIGNALPTSTESGATETNVPESVVQPLPEGEAIDVPQNEVETPDTQLISETAPTVMQAEEVHQEVQQGASLVEETGEEVQQEENFFATPIPISDTASTPSAISTNLLQRRTTADESSEVTATPESHSVPVESTAQLPELAADESSEVTATPESHSVPVESTVQLPELAADESSKVAATPESHSAPVHSTAQLPELAIEKIAVSKTADIISPTAPEESSIQRQAFPETEVQTASPVSPTNESVVSLQVTEVPQSLDLSAPVEETVAGAIAPTPEEAFAHPDITSPTSPEKSAIQKQPLLETEETAAGAIAPTPEEAFAAADITSPTTSEESSIQKQPLLETEEMAPSAIAPPQEEAIAHPDITSPTASEASSIQRQLLPETEETAPSAIAPSPEEAIAHPDIISPTAPEESAIQRQLLAETEETPPTAIAPIQEEAIAHPDITSPTAPEESAIQRQPLPETQEMAPSAIAPTQEEAIAHPDIISPTSSQESSIQRQLLAETEETPPTAIAPPQEEPIAHPDITSPTSPEESSIQRQPLLETAPVQTASTPSASETELPSTMSEAITTDSTLVMPKALPDEATPVSYPTQPEPLPPTELSQLDENTSLTEPIIAQPLLKSDANLPSERLPTVNNFEEVQENSPQVSPASPNSPALPAHLLQTKTNLTGDEAFNQNQDIPQLPTVLKNLVGSRHTLPLIQPLHQQSWLLSSTSTSEYSREQSTIVQSMPETSPLLVLQNTTPSALPEDAFNQGLQSTVKVPPVSLDTEPLTLQRATDAIPKMAPEFNQQTQQVGSSTYTSEIPNSWLSIADLLENTTTNSSSAFGGETPIQMAFNDGTNLESFNLQESNAWENVIPEYSLSSDASSRFSQDNPIQKFTTEEASIQDETSAAENPAQDKDDQDKNEPNLEILAREIYSLVRQRLAIERERYGHYY
jgi:hypothetical protein